MNQLPVRSPDPWENACFLVVDTETTGLQQAGKQPLRLVGIGWVLCHSLSDIEEEKAFRIASDNYLAPFSSETVNGTGEEMPVRECVPCRDALAAFWSAYRRCDVLVGHNLDFDEMVIYRESANMGLELSVSGRMQDRIRGRVCIMKGSAGLFSLPAGSGADWGWPSLLELYYALYPFHLLKEHQPTPGANMCARCFFALKNRGLLSSNGNIPPFWGLSTGSLAV